MQLLHTVRFAQSGDINKGLLFTKDEQSEMESLNFGAWPSQNVLGALSARGQKRRRKAVTAGVPGLVAEPY